MIRDSAIYLYNQHLLHNDLFKQKIEISIAGLICFSQYGPWKVTEPQG